MSMYKELSSDNINHSEYYAYKQWILTENDSNINIIRAQQITGSVFYPSSEPTASDGYSIRTHYDSIKHLYYHTDSRIDFAAANLYSQAVSGSIFHNKFYAPDHNFGPNLDKIYKSIGNKIVVISVPQQYIGDRIKPKTLQLEDESGYVLKDDGNGNIFDVANSASFSANKPAFTIGNIFYEHGNIVLTSLSSSYQNFASGSYLIKYKSTQKIYEMEAYCTAKEGEFNYSWNPSFRSGSSLMTTQVRNYVTGSEFSTYPTTIGLYNENNELLALGKLPQPIRKENNLALTFVVRLDM